MSLRAFTFVIFMLSVVIGGEAFCADKQQPTEYDVKAAYVYNFAKFVEWPAGKSQNAGGAMNICVAGEDPFGPALATIEGKGVGDRKIRIRRNTSLQEVKSCDVLFIGSSETEQLPRILEVIGDASVLTIGDTKGFAQQGVMINLYMENRNVRFAINPKAANRVGLKISSNLLRIARIVGEE